MQKKEKLVACGPFQNDSFESMQGELHYKTGNSHQAMASGCMLLFKTGEPAAWKACVLTAASNLVSFKPPAAPDESKDIRFLYSSKDTINCFGTFHGGPCDWFPEFSGAPDQATNVGLIWLKNAEKVFEPNAPNALNLSWDKSIEELNVQKGDQICVIGFGLNKLDLLYKMDTQLLNLKITKNGDFLLYYDLIQRQGLIGSPVLLKRNQMYHIIGVHSGTDSSKKYGYASGINQKILQWIRNMYENQSKV